jgi:hypothetical protein
VRADSTPSGRTLRKSLAISGHGYCNMAVRTIYGDVHSEVSGHLPIHFDGIQFPERLYEMLYALFVFPNNRKVIDYERESDAAVGVPKQGERMLELVVSILLQVLEQALLGQRSCLWQSIMGF